MLDAKIPEGDLAGKWHNHRFDMKLVTPKNRAQVQRHRGRHRPGRRRRGHPRRAGLPRRRVLLPGLARRAHSIAAQGGINAAKNYKNDGDSVYRLFYDTVKGGDFRAREANVYRLAEVSVNIIDQCVAQGVPFAREYGGLLDNRSFGGAQVSRTFYARGQTGQQLLLGAYQALARQVDAGKVKLHTRTEMLDLVVKDGGPAGSSPATSSPARSRSHAAHAVVLADRRIRQRLLPVDQRQGSNATATWRAYIAGRLFANPCYTQIHPTCIPVSGDYQSKLTLMSESLRNDGRIWAPKRPRRRTAPPDHIPDAERDYYLERKYPLRQPRAPRHRLPRQEGRRRGPASGPREAASTSTSATPSTATAASRGSPKYGNLFDMYERITGEARTRCRCASTPPSTTPWAACGSTTTCMSNVPACSCSARRTSSTTAPTASGARR